jgi:hypothetical protein
MSTDIPYDDKSNVLTPMQERWLGALLTVAAVLWIAAFVDGLAVGRSAEYLIGLLAAASTMSVICAVLFVGFGTRRAIVNELAALAVEVEAIRVKSEDREAAWSVLNKLTDDGAAVLPFRSERHT